MNVTSLRILIAMVQIDNLAYKVGAREGWTQVFAQVRKCPQVRGRPRFAHRREPDSQMHRGLPVSVQMWLMCIFNTQLRVYHPFNS